MINAKQLREFLNTTPFRPFRVHTSDGSFYEVPHTMLPSSLKPKWKSAWI